MTFEDTETLAPLTAEHDHGAGVWPVRTTAQYGERPVDVMLRFVNQATLMAEDLDGLAHLFRSTFEPEDGKIAPKLFAANLVIATCMESIASRLRLIDEHAGLRCEHFTERGVR